MNNFCAFASPLTSLPKSTSLRDSVTVVLYQHRSLFFCPAAVAGGTCVLSLTGRLLSIGGGALAGFASVFQIDVPALLCAVAVLEGEGEYGTAFLDGVFALGVVG